MRNHAGCAVLSTQIEEAARWTGIGSKEIGSSLRAKSKRNDDLDVINGRQDQLEGKIQERYGLAKDQAKEDVDAWFKSLP